MLFTVLQFSSEKRRRNPGKAWAGLLGARALPGLALA